MGEPETIELLTPKIMRAFVEALVSWQNGAQGHDYREGLRRILGSLERAGLTVGLAQMDENKFFKALAMHAAVTSPLDGGEAPEDARLYEAIFRAWAFAEDCSPFAGQNRSYNLEKASADFDIGRVHS